MSLLDVLSSSKKVNRVLSGSSSKKVTLPAEKYVNEVKPVGHVAVLERPGLFAEVKPNTVIVDKTARDYRLLITAILTKFPHYEFVAKVKSGELNRVKYWFKDTGSNITHVYSYKDMQDLLSRGLKGNNRVVLREQGMEEKEEHEIQRYSLFDDVPISYSNLLKIRYRLYKLNKYGTLDPFFTKFVAVKDKKVVEVKEYDKPAIVEQVEEKIDVPKILGSNGTNLQIVNGFIVSVKNV